VTVARARSLAILIGFFAIAAPASAQTLTAGDVVGNIVDVTGLPVGDVLLTLTEAGTGLTRTAMTTRGGRFSLALVVPGQYHLLAEHLGYRPTVVRGVAVRPGMTTDVAVTLNRAAPPVLRVDTVYLTSSAAVASGAGQWYPAPTLRGLPDPTGGVSDVTRLSSIVSPGFEAEGLPAELSGFSVDGLPYRPARNPRLPGGQLDSPLVRLSTLESAELVTNGGDVEWSGFGGGTLSEFGRLSTRDLQAHFSVDGTGNPLSGSPYFATGVVPNSSFRSALLVTGPIVRDSAHFVFGVEGERLETPLAAPLATIPVTDSLVAVAQDSFRVGLSNYLQPRVSATNAFTTFGGLAWRISEASDLSVQARYSTATSRNPDLGLDGSPNLGAGLDDRDFLGGATLRSALSRTLSQELSAGVQLSTRTYEATVPAATQFVDIGAAVGSDPALPGRYGRTMAHVSETLTAAAGAHHWKFGADLSLNSYDQTTGLGSPGAFVFSGPSSFAGRMGAFTQDVFTEPEVQFSVPQIGIYAQDRITASPGLDLLLGFRFDEEKLPQSDVLGNQAWQKATGLSDTAFATGLGKVSPRVGFTWDLNDRHRTILKGVSGVYFDEIDPGIMGEVIRESLGDTVRGALGSLSGWPAGAAPAPLLGSNLMLLAPDLQAPRTGRLELSLLQQLHDGLTATLSGTYRHTDFLPRRANLNLPSAPTGYDQYGRPIYGTLVQEGQLVTVAPGTNERFAGFDVVSAINSDGYSDYWGLTLTLDRQVGAGLRLLASYTYSQTTDNLLAAAGGVPGGGLSPFPDSLAGQDWANGTSNLDVPSRFLLAAEIQTKLPLAPRLAVMYRYQSGAPFTPGFQGGVDASGTGSGNDPAFIDASVPGTSALLGQWACLRGQVGRFAARNSCRDPSVQGLDLRATVNLVRAGHTPVVLVIDALNVLQSDVGLRDHALYLIDATKSLTVNAAGVVNVPLVANPNFGNVLVHAATGRELRIGLRANY